MSSSAGVGRTSVLVDHQTFLMYRRGGISRYFAELLRCYWEHPELEVDAQISLRRSSNSHLLAVAPQVRPLPFRPDSLPYRAAQVAERRRARRAAGALHPDLVHSTYYRPEDLDLVPGARRVVTVHDLIPERHPEWFGDRPVHLAMRDYIDAADGIVCVSQATKDELFELWGEIDDRPVIVTHHAAGPLFTPHGPGWDLGRPYLLHIGDRELYKDFPTLVRAFAQCEARTSGLALAVVGGKDLLPEEKQLIDDLGVADDLIVLSAGEAELPRLYRSAVALVSPSTVEGFGMPVVESMTCGTPVVLADTPVYREVAGAAGLFFTPGDEEALRDQLDRLTTDDDLAAAAAQAGLTRAADFSWDSTAASTAALYRDLIC